MSVELVGKWKPNTAQDVVDAFKQLELVRSGNQKYSLGVAPNFNLTLVEDASEKALNAVKLLAYNFKHFDEIGTLGNKLLVSGSVENLEDVVRITSKWDSEITAEERSFGFGGISVFIGREKNIAKLIYKDVSEISIAAKNIRSRVLKREKEKTIALCEQWLRAPNAENAASLKQSFRTHNLIIPQELTRSFVVKKLQELKA